MKLTEQQRLALTDANSNGGKIFQTPGVARQKHSPSTLASLVKRGLLNRAPVGVIWILTEAGRAELQAN